MTSRPVHAVVQEPAAASAAEAPADNAAVAALRASILDKLAHAIGRSADEATSFDWYHATALAVRDHVTDIWRATRADTAKHQRKRVYYLSIEFLVGRFLLDILTNLRMTETAREALSGLGLSLDELAQHEPDAGLGNGGLGRLAACYLDSMSALAIPAIGYGIRYEHGLFEQRFNHGQQQEVPDRWLAHGNPWEFPRSDISYPIRFGGAVEYLGGDQTTASAIWYPEETLSAVAFDVPIAGWRGRHANTLRLWCAQAPSAIQLLAQGAQTLEAGSAAVHRARQICDVLYPSDATDEGRELRLRQEYFFTSAALQDIVARHLAEHETLETLPDFVAIQLNDTHPAIAVPELMRILIDEHGFSWQRAWDITRASLSYTNHTLLPEALESWPVGLLSRLLPRHLQIIYLINWLHLKEANAGGEHDAGFIARISLVHEDGERRIRMGHLAFVGSHSVNGVSALHTDLLRATVFGELARVTDTRIENKTNGITFRRWLFEANPGLTKLICDTIGTTVLDEPEQLAQLQSRAADSHFAGAYMQVRKENKQKLAQIITRATGISVDATAMFDVHIKRIHEYKRQLLNILETIALWQAMRAHPDKDWVPRVKIFAGKAAASYERAKLIIRLINDVATAVNKDALLRGRLKVAFIPNYSVSLAQALVCAADVSEQISTAGMEASGTGNMKLALNGAITIGTLDGATVEIRDRVGAENVVIFGLTAQEVEQRRRALYRGGDAVSAELAGVIDALESGAASPGEPQRYAGIVQSLLAYDPFMVAADFDSYWQAQRKLDTLWCDPAQWARMSISNTARMGWFNSDRAIREYAETIWKVPVTA